MAPLAPLFPPPMDQGVSHIGHESTDTMQIVSSWHWQLVVKIVVAVHHTRVKLKRSGKIKHLI